MLAPVGVSDVFPYQFVVYAFALLSLLIPAPTHFKSGNIGVIALITYNLLFVLILLINAIVWRGNINDPAPYYCDLTTFISSIGPVGLSASILCITRQLHRLAKAQAVITTAAEKRKHLIIDLVTVLVVPLLAGGGHAIVQGHRYNIIEDVGCIPTTYNVTLAFPLYWIWSPLISYISSIYGLLAVREFLKRRKSFEMLLSSNSTGMQKNRYIRLMWLCCVDLVLSIPASTYFLIDQAANHPVVPWVSWEDTQTDWYRVDFYRRFIIDKAPSLRTNLLVLMFSSSTTALIFFAMFGFTRETIKTYKSAFYWCMKPFGIKKPVRNALPITAPRKRTWVDKMLGRKEIPLNSTSNTTGSIPTFVQQNKSIPSARPKASMTTSSGSAMSATDTLNWSDFDLKGEENEISSPVSGRSVLVIDGRRLTIPGLNAMASFDSDDLYDEKAHREASHGSHSPV